MTLPVIIPPQSYTEVLKYTGGGGESERKAIKLKEREKSILSIFVLTYFTYLFAS